MNDRLVTDAWPRRSADFPEPIGNQEMTEGAPAVRRHRAGIVAGEIISRQADRLASHAVALEFLAQRSGIVFQMIEHVDRAAGAICHQAESRFG